MRGNLRSQRPTKRSQVRSASLTQQEILLSDADRPDGRHRFVSGPGPRPAKPILALRRRRRRRRPRLQQLHLLCAVKPTMKTSPLITVQQHILEEQRRHCPNATGEFSWLLSGITLATKIVAAQVRRAGLGAII